MRKTWVKRENIYYKPFYKQKSKMFLLLIFLVGISFIAYQVSPNKLLQFGFKVRPLMCKINNN